VFLLVEPRWAPFFGDEDADIDWRLVSWGRVRMDQRGLRVTANHAGTRASRHPMIQC
jgi:hypothetical protein